MKCRCAGSQFLPAELSGLSALTELSLVGTALPDLPPWLAELPALRRLRVAGARMHGQLGTPLVQLPGGCPLSRCLTRLELSNCRMMSLPHEACTISPEPRVISMF